MIPLQSTYQLLYSEPLFSRLPAHILSLAFGFIYVGVLYLSQRARVSFAANVHTIKGTRDDPDIIKARLIAVSIATLACCGGVYCILLRHEQKYGNMDFPTLRDGTLLRLGLPLYIQQPTWETVRAHLVVPVLFLGPLFACGLEGQLPLQSRWYWRAQVAERLFTLQGARNYMIAPLTEELVFRACVLAVWHMAGMGMKMMVFASPLTFGLAHVHHGLETYHRGGGTRTAARQAIISTLFQLIYTTIFGMLASFLFLRTGSILPPFSAHVFCNIMGLPDPVYEVQRHPKKKKMIYYAYLLGIIGFILTLWRWTETPESMYWLYGTMQKRLKY